MALGQAQSYTVRDGDTLSGIAARLGVSQQALLQANNLPDPHRLRVGMTLRVPQRTAPTTARTSNAPAAGAATVRAGDNDITIARRLGVTPQALRDANPGVRWTRLQIGQTLRVPGGTAASPRTASRPNSPTRTATAPTAAPSTVTVRSGDNDWVIARRLGITPSQLRQANPNVNWTRLQIGQQLRVPGGARVAATSGGSNAGGQIGRFAAVDASAVVLRSGPSTNRSRVGTANRGEMVTVLDRESGWYRLRFANGRVGWVRGDLLRPLTAREVAQMESRTRVASQDPYRRATPVAGASRPNLSGIASSGLAIIDKAMSLQGTRYRYGGMSRSGLDCSGFTSLVFQSMGVRLPRTSAQQATVGTAVSRSQLRAGDLVFFNTRGRRISHVGIYVGGGKFVHASSARGNVRVDSMRDGYYDRRFVTARRVGNVGTKASPQVANAATEAPAKPAAVAKAEPETEPIETTPTPTQGADDIVR
ncbi:MAG: LysM peptidoglycan-binding domain-containing protein [Fimbriimonadaceae bacterium]